MNAVILISMTVTQLASARMYSGPFTVPAQKDFEIRGPEIVTVADVRAKSVMPIIAIIEVIVASTMGNQFVGGHNILNIFVLRRSR